MFTVKTSAMLQALKHYESFVTPDDIQKEAKDVVRARAILHRKTSKLYCLLHDRPTCCLIRRNVNLLTC